MSRLPQCLAVVAAATGALLVTTAGAQAYVTVGPPLTSLDQATTPRSGAVAIVHQQQPGYRVVSPIKGVLTGWRVVGEGTFQLFTGTYADPVNSVFTRAKLTDKRTHGSLTAPSKLFYARNRVNAGDYIGIVVHTGGRIAFKRDIAGGDLDMWTPAPGLGAPTAANLFHDLTNRAGFQAVIETDADEDGYGADTQDGCDGDALTIGPCGATTPTPPAPEPEDGAPQPDIDVPLPPEEPLPDDPGMDFPLLPDDGASLVGDLSFDVEPRIKKAFRARRGATLFFDLSRAATATVEVQRLVKVRVKVKGGKRRLRERARFIGQMTQQVGADMTKLNVRNRIAGRRLVRGSYRLHVKASANDDSGSAARSNWVRFRITGR